MSKIFNSFFGGSTPVANYTFKNNVINAVPSGFLPITQVGEPIKPVVYDDMSEAGNVKIVEKYPNFGFGGLLDEILESFGGVQEIMECNWDKELNEGGVICLMKDWRVFRYYVKQSALAGLTHDERVSKINCDCKLFEDMDDWGHWEDMGGIREEEEKRVLKIKKEREKTLEETEKYNEALRNFFNGDSDAMKNYITASDKVG